jgi:hypothetical protein
MDEDLCESLDRISLCNGHDVEEDHEVVAEAAGQAEDMENAVDAGLFVGTDGIKDCADHVEEAAGQEKDRSAPAQSAHDRDDPHQDAPAHDEVAAVGQDAVFVKVDGGENTAQDSRCPDDSENDPAHGRIEAADGDEGHGGVSPRDQKINGAVVKYLHDFFGHGLFKAVINAGNGIEQDHGGAEDGSGNDGPNGSAKGSHDHAGDQGYDAKRCADYVADHVKYFVPAGIVGKRTIFQRGSRHEGLLSLIGPYKRK